MPTIALHRGLALLLDLMAKKSPEKGAVISLPVPAWMINVARRLFLFLQIAVQKIQCIGTLGFAVDPEGVIFIRRMQSQDSIFPMAFAVALSTHGPSNVGLYALPVIMWHNKRRTW